MKRSTTILAIAGKSTEDAKYDDALIAAAATESIAAFGDRR